MTASGEQKPEPKLCIDCTKYDGITRCCRRWMRGRSLVDGKVELVFAVVARGDASLCGAEAKMFEAKKQPF